MSRSKPLDIVFRFRDPAGGVRRPRTVAEAARVLVQGNRRFAAMVRSGVGGVVECDRRELGASERGRAPRQEPFACIITCSDARISTDLLFGEGFNEIFSVRVAGNVLGEECLGSVRYALDSFPTLRLIAVVGHAHCGAVAAGVELYRSPIGFASKELARPITSIVDQLLAPIRVADTASRRSASDSELVATAVAVNAGLAAWRLRQVVAECGYGRRVGVRWGVYDLVSRLVGAPWAPERGALLEAPRSGRGIEAIARRCATGC